MWPTLEALKAMGGSGTNEEILAKVIEVAQIPPEVQTVQHTDGRQTKLNYNVAWAKSYLKKAGAIDNSTRGVWSITKQGETVTWTKINTCWPVFESRGGRGWGAGDRPPARRRWI